MEGLGTWVAESVNLLQLQISPSHMNTALKRLLLAGGLAAASVTLVAAADEKTTGPKEMPATVPDNAKIVPMPASSADKTKVAQLTTSPEVQKLVDQFGKQRDTILANRQKLIDQLKGATEEERKAIIEKLQQQQKDMADQMRELSKLQRDEARKQRENSAKPGGR